MLISIVTIFPDFFAEVFDFGMIRQGRKKGLLET
ncbi:MAG: tRNA (guanosine(37)-N1)-methyltransferase TrmD, partial [Acidobacteria bacterium]|nr:tRNA (guanosine(37)-N1)-methyltransferase TrmD [Acidobacteriota bacterium]